MAKQLRWQEIANSITYHENEIKNLSSEWTKLKDNCQHLNLPKHSLLDEYHDTCPDCGFISYCMKI